MVLGYLFSLGKESIQVVGVVVPRGIGDVQAIELVEPRSKQLLGLGDSHVWSDERLHTEVVIGAPRVICPNHEGRGTNVVVSVCAGIDEWLKVVNV